MQRIQFANTNGGSGAYTLTYNPTSLEWPNDDNTVSIEMTDSENAIQKRAFDARQIKMVWNNYSKDTAGFVTMITVLIGYKGLKKYIHLQDVAGLVLSDSTNWKGPYRIINVTPIIREGQALRWSSVELLMQKAGL